MSEADNLTRFWEKVPDEFEFRYLYVVEGEAHCVLREKGTQSTWDIVHEDSVNGTSITIRDPLKSQIRLVALLASEVELYYAEDLEELLNE